MKLMPIATPILSLISCSAFTPAQQPRRPTSLDAAVDSRRAFLGVSAAAVVATWSVPSLAEEGDLTTQLFNADGSLKEEMETEAKFRKVELSWDVSDQAIVVQDGSNPATTGSAVNVSYQLPEKWGTGNDLYLDKKEGAKACNRITVYQAAGKADMKRLEKASMTGIGKALDVTEGLKEVRGADLIGGKSSSRDGLKYYDFDMAVAPKTCEASSDDLGLGFCPYDSIYLLSSTVLNDRLYVFALQCSKDEWKRANSDLRRVRSSFSVQQA